MGACRRPVAWGSDAVDDSDVAAISDWVVRQGIAGASETELLNGFASLPNGLIVGPDGALYTSNWTISFAADGGDGQILRIVP